MTTLPHISTDDTGANGNFMRVTWPAKDGKGYDQDPETGSTAYPRIKEGCEAIKARGYDDCTIGTDTNAIEVARVMGWAV